MANQILQDLIREAASLDISGGRWLLQASALSEAICEAVLGDPSELEDVQHAVRETAALAGCGLIVGASPAAKRVVRGLDAPGEEPSKALVFEIVRVTGATFVRTQQELHHVDVVPAVLVDLNPSSRPPDVLSVGAFGL